MNPVSQDLPILRFRLGAEELALGLGLLNRPELGHQVLGAIYPELDETKVNLCLSSALHSALAHGLCVLDNNQSPLLVQPVAQTLQPLVSFDHFFQLSYTYQEQATTTVVYVLQDHAFTAQQVQQGVVYTLEHALYDAFADYMSRLFGPLGTKLPGDKNFKIEKPLSFTALAQVSNRNLPVEQAQELLLGHGWTAAASKILMDDVKEQRLSAVLQRVNVNQKSVALAAHQAPTPVFCVINSTNRSWVFTFSSADPDAMGYGQVVSQQGFNELIEEFVR